MCIEFRGKINFASDITASSQLGFDGSVNIETPGIEPNPERLELPEDAQSTEVAQGCQASGESSGGIFQYWAWWFTAATGRYFEE